MNVQWEHVHLKNGSFEFWTGDPLVLDVMELGPALLMAVAFVVCISLGFRAWRREVKANRERTCEKALTPKERCCQMAVIGMCGAVGLAATILAGWALATWMMQSPHPRAVLLGTGVVCCVFMIGMVFMRPRSSPAKVDEEQTGEASGDEKQQAPVVCGGKK